jgi:uncharacterized protein YkwD
MSRFDRTPLWLPLLLGTLSACGGAGTVDLGTGDDGFSGTPPGFALAVFDRVNRERVAAGVAPLEWHEATGTVAQAHSLDMEQRDYFSHVNPEGQDPADRLRAAGVDCWRVGENIAQGQDDPDEVMNDWMASPGHRANILDPEFRQIGIGVYGGPHGTYWTQDFLVP